MIRRRTSIQLALKYLGLDPNTTKREDYKAAENLLLKVRPYIRSFDSAEYLNALANQELCVAMSWSSDYALAHARAKAAGVNVNLAFSVPQEGANENFSSLLIPQVRRIPMRLTNSSISSCGPT